MKRIIGIIFCISVISCGQYNARLENALKLAGDNRYELEKVLHHYSRESTDSLKLQAAKFLIENMPGHYTLEGSLINTYREKIYSDTTMTYFDKKAIEISLCQIDWLQNMSQKIEDIKQITANFLIRHIDLTFEHLYNPIQQEDIPFDVFLDYILPYRFENEKLDLWRDSLHFSPDILKEFDYNQYINYSISDLREILTSEKSELYSRFTFLPELFKQDIYSNCVHIALKENLYARVFCFPSAINFFPHYANRNGFHHWNTIISSELKNTNVKSFYTCKAAKIFRKTYSRQEIPVPSKDEYIPDFFQNPFYKDVTDQYMYTANITVQPREEINPTIHHAYLCVFNNLKWTPVVIGNFNNNHGEFKNIGKNIIYLPAYYRKTQIHPLNYPFILDLQGKQKYLIPDTNIHQKLLIARKYPIDRHLHLYNRDLKDMIIEAANRPDFQHTDTILSCLDDNITYTQGVVKTQKEYRYWRISHPTWCEFSELLFTDAEGNSLKVNSDSIYSAGFDNDPLTNTYIREGSKIEIDFHFPVKISKITCLPRSDGNSIYPGNDYELFYYGPEGWISLGRQVATNYSVQYDNVPAGALLWLHNHTTGVEERIFTYEAGKIRFW